MAVLGGFLLLLLLLCHCEMGQLTHPQAHLNNAANPMSSQLTNTKCR
jgi:hypothetical protein